MADEDKIKISRDIKVRQKNVSRTVTPDSSGAQNTGGSDASPVTYKPAPDAPSGGQVQDGGDDIAPAAEPVTKSPGGGTSEPNTGGPVNPAEAASQPPAEDGGGGDGGQGPGGKTPAAPDAKPEAPGEEGKQKPDSPQETAAGGGAVPTAAVAPAGVAPATDPSAISPSLKQDDLEKPVDLGNKPTETAKEKGKGADDKGHEGLKDKGKDAAKEAEKKGAKLLAKQAGAVIAKAAASAAAWAASAIGWPVIIIIAIICIIAIIIFGGIGCQALNGYLGKTLPQPAGKDAEETKSLIDKNKAAAKAPDKSNLSGFKNLDFMDPTDKKYVAEGNLDKRLSLALAYIAEKHSRIGISHIISGYQASTKNPESGSDRDPKVSSSISAHQDGLAADVAEIDFFYKVQKINLKTNYCKFIFYSDGTKKDSDLDFTALSNGDFITADRLEEIIDDAFNQAKAVLDDALKTNDDIKSTMSGNQGKIEDSLGDQKALFSDTMNELEQASEQIRKAQAELPTAINKMKNLSRSIRDARTKLAGVSGEIPEVADFNKQLGEAQKVVNAATQKLDQANNMIRDNNNNLDADKQNLDQILGGDTIDQTAMKDALTDIRNNAGSIKNISSLSFLSNLGPFGEYLDLTQILINQLTDMLAQNLKELWKETFDNLVGQITGSDGILGGLLGDKDKLYERGCDIFEMGKMITNNSSYKGGGTADLDGTVTNTQAIPIKVAWQDKKPTDANVGSPGNLNMPESILSALIDYYVVYQPEARRKTHTVIGELLEFPYLAPNINDYKITQLITYSEERDVNPFKEIADKLYGTAHPPNYGLFSMPESWAQVHIGY